MRTRRLFVSLAIVAAGTGVFFAGRASVSNTPVSTAHPSGVSIDDASFSPISVDFYSLESGWVLGTTPCRRSSMCLSILRSTNAGRSWSKARLPSSLIQLADRKVSGSSTNLKGTRNGYDADYLDVRFANAKDGWIYGSLPYPAKVNGHKSVTYRPVFWSTHDGGLEWKRQRQSWIYSQGPILDVEASSGTVYLMAFNRSFGVTVESSPVGDDNWRVSDTKDLFTPAGGGPLSGAIVLSGSHGWLVEGNDRGTTGSAQLNSSGKWISWTPPCESVGGSLAVPAVSTLSHLVAECIMGGFASPLSPDAPRGATLGSSWLYFSDNGGKTFTAGPELGADSEYFGSLLASPKPKTILLARNYFPRQELVASFNGGRSWTMVYSGDVTFMRFDSPTEGVAIVETAKGPNQMIMTFDGGYNWFPIYF